VALSKLYDAIRQEQSSMAGLTFLGELRETIRMIRNPAEALRRATLEVMEAYGSLSRRQKRQTRAALMRARADVAASKAATRGISGSILELNFGVKPLVSDIADIATTAYDLINGRNRQATRLYGKASEEFEPIEGGGLVRLSGGLGLCVNHLSTTVDKIDVQWLCGYDHTLDGPSGVLRALRAYGIKGEEIPLTLWELFPFSFLADYFLNIGKVLEALCTCTSQVTWMCKTVRHTRMISEWQHFVYSSPSDLQELDRIDHYKWPLGKCELERKAVRRTKPYALEIPPLYSHLPGENSVKWLNIAALCAQFAARR
jgi:hypothetical protein